jgi:heme exporter protein D
MDEFFHMGGYAAFVWPAYLASALGVGGLAFFIWRRGRTLARRLKSLEDAAARPNEPAVFAASAEKTPDA